MVIRPQRTLHRFVATCCALIFAALLCGQAPATALAKPQRLFWKITTPTTEVYFLGSIHVATKDMYPLPPEIEAAYKKADSLMVEADVTRVDQAALALQITMRGLYAADDSLAKHVSPETMKKLELFCNANHFSSTILGSMKPPLAAMTVEALTMTNMGLNPEDGVDMHFLKQATDEKKKILELEKAEAQLDIVFSIDDKLAEKWLTETLKDNGKDEIDKILKAWVAGDAKAVETSVIEDAKNDPDEQKLTDLLVYKRNDEMTKKIADLLTGKEKVFVVVGAAHLVGEKGILKQLEAKGYKVERPELTAPPPATSTFPALSPATPQ